MSIWSSIGNTIGAADAHHPDTNVYAGTGPKDVEIDVAHCGSWHQSLRLAAWSLDRGLDVELMLDRAAVVRLRDKLTEALRLTDGCTCPDRDVSRLGQEPGSHTIKGLDPSCPIHGKGTKA